MIDNYLYMLRKSFISANILYDFNHHVRDYFLLTNFLQFYNFQPPANNTQEKTSNVKPSSTVKEEEE
jgi:hypothetical protein